MHSSSSLIPSVESAKEHFNAQIDKHLDHYAGKIAKRAFRNTLPDLILAVQQQSAQEIERLEKELSVLRSQRAR